MQRKNNRYAGERGSTLTWHSSLAFHWEMELDGMLRESDVHIRADHAAERGVPLPEGWQILLRLDVFAHMAVQRAREELSLSDAAKLDCRLALLSFAHTYTVAHRSRIVHRSRIDAKKKQQVYR